jgi:hypothetical protein
MTMVGHAKPKTNTARSTASATVMKIAPDAHRQRASFIACSLSLSWSIARTKWRPGTHEFLAQERRAPGLTSRGRINATGFKENELEAAGVPPSTTSRSEGRATKEDLADCEGDEIDANNHHKSQQASVNETGGIAFNEFRHCVTPSNKRPGRQRGLTGSGVDAGPSLQTSTS